MNEVMVLCEETELKLISAIKDRNLKEVKNLTKLWQSILEVHSELLEN